jgi:hypothetical protein
MSVDSKVFALACDFVDDTINDIDREMPASDRRKFYERAAEAMQRAIEDECLDIENELKPDDLPLFPEAS